MAQKNIGTGWTRDSRNAMNDNFDELFAVRNVLQKQISDIVIDSGTSDAETIQARGEFPVLNDRLDSVSSQLAEKASQSSLNNTNNEVARKSEQTYVDDKLVEKAFQSDLVIERARISTLVANAGNTDGNAELLDIRVGFDGVTYPTAGEATRALSKYMKTNGDIWEVD